MLKPDEGRSQAVMMPWDAPDQERCADALASMLTQRMVEAGAVHESAYYEDVPWLLCLARALTHSTGNSLAQMTGESLRQDLRQMCSGLDLCTECGSHLEDDYCPQCKEDRGHA
jgi:hypothetical protein